jgi:hypothetical protein
VIIKIIVIDGFIAFLPVGHFTTSNDFVAFHAIAWNGCHYLLKKI